MGIGLEPRVPTAPARRRLTRCRLLAVGLALVIAGGGCGGDDDGDGGAGSAGEPATSSVEEFPLPPGATLDETASEDDRQVYRLPRMPESMARPLFANQLPGPDSIRPFGEGEFEWCGESEPTPTSIERAWRSTSDGKFVVAVLELSAENSVLTVSREDSGTTRACSPPA